MAFNSRGTKKSTFLAGTAAASNTFDYIQNRINKRGSIQQIINLVADVYGASLRTYEFESEMVAADIALGEYAIVEENNYAFYKITNDAATFPNVALTSGLTATFEKAIGNDAPQEYVSMAAHIAGTPATDTIYIQSYSAWAPGSTTPKGGHFRYRTGGTNTSPTVGSAVAVSTIGTGTQAGYSWDASGAEWVILDQPYYTPQQFGAVGDGTTDDASAFQDVSNFISTKGGVINIPAANVYVLNSEITFTSTHAISIISEMGADNTATPTGCIIPGANITGSMFNISCRGGTIKGLWFTDLTGQIGVSQGTYTMDAALKLTTFGMGKVEYCYFDQILGAGLEVDNMIRGNLTGIHMRDCGTPTKPAFWLNSQTSLAAGQITITNCHLETCYGDYLSLTSNSNNTKISDCHFESDDANSDTHNEYISNAGALTLIDTCSFNQQGGIYVNLTSARTQINNCSFGALSGALSLARIRLSSSFNTISNCVFNGTSADVGTVIDDISGNSSFANNIINAGGNVKLGPGSDWVGGKIINSVTTEAYCIAMSSESSVSAVKIDGATIAGGISATTRCNVSGATVRGCNGIGLINNSSTATIVGNSLSNNTAGDLSFSGYPSGYSPNSNYVADGSIPLSASTTWNPASIADGASESLNITVTGAASGDFPIPSFPMIASASSVAGMSISANVYASDTVKVTIANNSGGAVDLDSGTLKVNVLKG